MLQQTLNPENLQPENWTLNPESRTLNLEPSTRRRARQEVHRATVVS